MRCYSYAPSSPRLAMTINRLAGQPPVWILVSLACLGLLSLATIWRAGEVTFANRAQLSTREQLSSSGDAGAAVDELQHLQGRVTALEEAVNDIKNAAAKVDATLQTSLKRLEAIENPKLEGVAALLAKAKEGHMLMLRDPNQANLCLEAAVGDGGEGSDAKNGRLRLVEAPQDEVYSLKAKLFQMEPVAWHKDMVLLRSTATGKYLQARERGKAMGYDVSATVDEVPSGFCYFELQEDGQGTGRFHLYNPKANSYVGRNDRTVDRQASKDPAVTAWRFDWVTPEAFEQNEEDYKRDQEYIAQIRKLPPSDERRVISYGLYGTQAKYTKGAVRNAKLAPIYFPGWTGRFYVDSVSVPEDVVTELRSLDAKIVLMNGNAAKTAGMFWRFLVADDPAVDRFIIRDTGSRPNARDRLAVEDWITSGKVLHSIRDHTLHCHLLNGGMWGATKGAIKDMGSRIEAWTNKDKKGDDMDFLKTQIWSSVSEADNLAHDAFCCETFGNGTGANIVPFTTKRYHSHQHVGQIFNADNTPVIDFIERFVMYLSPKKCRGQPDWEHA